MATVQAQQQQKQGLKHMPKGMLVSMAANKALPTVEDRDENAPPPNEAQETQSNRQQGSSKALVPQHQKKDLQPPVFASQPRNSLVNLSTRRQGSTVSRQMHRQQGQGIDPVDMICNRLLAWRLALKNLVCCTIMQSTRYID